MKRDPNAPMSGKRTSLLTLSLLLTMSLFTAQLHAGDKELSSQSEAVPLPTLLFFINPNGRPCQMQDEIIQSMKPALDSLATLRYVSTMVREDLQSFSKFGIRGLPMLIITDHTGKELKRLSPGVQNAKTIASTLQSLSAKK